MTDHPFGWHFAPGTGEAYFQLPTGQCDSGAKDRLRCSPIRPEEMTIAANLVGNDAPRFVWLVEYVGITSPSLLRTLDGLALTPEEAVQEWITRCRKQCFESARRLGLFSRPMCSAFPLGELSD